MLTTWQGIYLVTASGLLALVSRQGTDGALRALRMAEDGLRDADMGEAADEVYALACGIGGGHIALR